MTDPLSVIIIVVIAFGGGYISGYYADYNEKNRQEIEAERRKK